MSDPSSGAAGEAIACTWMRGGTSKGGFFRSEHLPSDPELRDTVLARIFGSSDARQIDGMGGGHPLTSKAAIVGPSTHPECDVDYLFLQIQPDTGAVSDSQNCGNILAGVGPFAIETGLVEPGDPETRVRVHMTNSRSRADLTIQTPGGRVTYSGSAEISGVPGSHAPVLQSFFDTAGAQCGALLPTSNPVDMIAGTEVTLIDNGMPVVLLRAENFGLSGYEAIDDLEADELLKSKLETIRLEAGALMGLEDVSTKTTPKMCLVSPSRLGGLINTRTFIPHRVHQSIGVLAAASIVAGCALEGSVASGMIEQDLISPCRVQVEHPTGHLIVEMDWDGQTIHRTGFVRTARKLMEGKVFL